MIRSTSIDLAATPAGVASAAPQFRGCRSCLARRPANRWHPSGMAVAAVLWDMDRELAALEQRRDKTRPLKQGMMQELLTGRTRLV